MHIHELLVNDCVNRNDNDRRSPRGCAAGEEGLHLVVEIVRCRPAPQGLEPVDSFPTLIGSIAEVLYDPEGGMECFETPAFQSPLSMLAKGMDCQLLCSRELGITAAASESRR